MEFPLWPADHAAAVDVLAGAAPPFIGLHPAARDSTKRWPPERIVAVGNELQRWHGGTVLLLGGAEEHGLCEAMTAGIPGPCRNLAGSIPLPTLGAVIARLAVLVTNDSGPAHIAYALGTPTVTVFGGTDPAVWGPPAGGPHRVALREVPCRPCDHVECPVGYACLAGLAVTEVAQAATAVLAGGRGGGNAAAR